MNNLRLGEVLIEENCITREQLDSVLQIQKQSETKKRIGELLLDAGYITETQMLSALSKRMNAEYIKLSDYKIDINAVKLVPKTISQRYTLIPLEATESEITIIMNDPLDFYAIEDIKLITNRNVKIKTTEKKDINKAIQYWYAEIDAQRAAFNANELVKDIASIELEDLSDMNSEIPAVTLVNTTLFKAYSVGASDIHIEPFEDKTIVRIRVDGQIVEFLTLSVALHNSIITRIKILSSLDIAEKRIPQDGHFRAMLGDIQINVRVSVLPTINGEKAVLRFLSKSANLDNFKTFGMRSEDYEKFDRMLKSPHGIIYITGPTGSGKTTTLYMALERLAKGNVNISTIEDPVERTLAGINQTQTNPLAGLTFEIGLRALLRQDPDIIMVGETRDSETASIAVRAAITGHLVLSTLHTNDAVSAIVRLADMGVENFMIANSLVGVVAQRLVKKICPNCKEEYTATLDDKKMLGNESILTLYRGRGCPNCNNTGYKGRIAIHEILVIDKEFRSMIYQNLTADVISGYLQEHGKLTTLKASMEKLVLDGITTVEEYTKLTYFSE